MPEVPPVLDYAPAPATLWRRIAQRVEAIVRAIQWLLFTHQLTALEIAIGCWIGWTGLYIFFAARRFELGSDALKPALALLWILPALIVTALAKLVINRSWHGCILFAIALVVGIALSGMAQYEQCPHAKYVQIFGISIAYEGLPCGNPRHVEPWWMRR